MSLDISPEVENLLEQEARRAGVSVDTLLTRTFAP
jgi:predicted HicB family RNase H-like nuclease